MRMTDGGMESGGGGKKHMESIASEDSFQLSDTLPVTVHTCGIPLRDSRGEDAGDQRRHEDLVHHLSPPVRSLRPVRPVPPALEVGRRARVRARPSLQGILVHLHDIRSAEQRQTAVRSSSGLAATPGQLLVRARAAYPGAAPRAMSASSGLGSTPLDASTSTPPLLRSSAALSRIPVCFVACPDASSSLGLATLQVRFGSLICSSRASSPLGPARSGSPLPGRTAPAIPISAMLSPCWPAASWMLISPSRLPGNGRRLASSSS